MKKTILSLTPLVFAIPLLAQMPNWEKYDVETVLAMANPPMENEDFYVVDSLYCYQFDSTLTEQPVNRKYNLNFTSEGAVLESISQDYDSDLNEWENTIKELFTYDAAGNVFERVEQNWNDGTQNWMNNLREVNTWNASSVLELNVKQTWFPGGNNWRNFERLTFEYDNDGYIASFQQELWDTLAFGWERQFRILYAVDEDGLVVSTIFQLWQDNEYNSLSRTISTFDGANEIEKVTEVWNGYDEIWVNSSRQIFDYDANDNQTSLTNQIWLVQDSTWENQNRNLKNYNAGGDVTLETLLTWGGDNWVNFFQTNFEYDTLGNNTRFEVAEWQIVEWVPFSSCDFYWRFSHTVISDVDEVEVSCAIPNPYRMGTSVSCADLPTGKNLSLNLFDLSGKMVHAQALGPQNLINIAEPLKEGLYVLAVKDGNEVLLAQKIYIY